MRTEILYEDNSVLVIRKPAGLAVQSARIGQADVVSELKSYLAKQAGAGQGEPYLAVIHRLDQPVEGVLVFAKEKKSAAVLTKQLSAGTLNNSIMQYSVDILMLRKGSLWIIYGKRAAWQWQSPAERRIFRTQRSQNCIIAFWRKLISLCRWHWQMSALGPDGSTRSACSLPMRDGRCWEIPNTGTLQSPERRGVRHIAAWHFAHILWILPIPATAKRCHSG